MADYRNSGIQNAGGTVNVGLADNNPGDIKFDGTDWKGSVGSDGTFVIFSDTTFGLRAIAVDLTTKITKDGLNTVSKIVNAYAPASDNNDVASYIAAVSHDTGFGPDQVLAADVPTLTTLVRAIVNHEIGDDLSSQYVTDADIAAGVSMTNPVIASAKVVAVAATNNPGMTTLFITAGVLLISRFLD